MTRADEEQLRRIEGLSTPARDGGGTRSQAERQDFLGERQILGIG